MVQGLLQMMLDSPVTEGRHLGHCFFQVSSSHGRILSYLPLQHEQLVISHQPEPSRVWFPDRDVVLAQELCFVDDPVDCLLVLSNPLSDVPRT